MKFLLDTHVFIWVASEPEKLSTYAKTLIQEQENVLFVSIVSIWEIQIKNQLGKLTLTQSLEELIEQQREMNQIQLLPLALDHVLALNNLSFYHKDPFDRLLISQARSETLSIITHDIQFKSYPITVQW